MTDRISSCPACDQKLEIINDSKGDWTNYTCKRHGIFKLSNTLSVTLIRSPEHTTKVARYLESPHDQNHVICTDDVGI